MKFLITGFDPFNNEKLNPSLECIKLLPKFIDENQIIKLEIPTVFKKSLQIIESAINKYNPDVIISIGQATGRHDITPERIAINIEDARIKDNEGNQPIDNVIFKDGKSAYFSTLPIKSMVKKMIENNISASVSNSAGTFVCNHVMYGTLYLIEKKYHNIKAGFIHIPNIPDQIGLNSNTPSMELETIVTGLNLCIKAIIENTKDIHYPNGTIC